MASAPVATRTLYERLGGVYSIATVVEDLLVTEMVCWAAGGPQRYTGRSMVDSHRDLNITAQEWEAFLDDFRQTLDEFEVPAPEQAELRAIVQSTYGDIVGSKA